MIFNSGDFILHSGEHTDWVIDCDAFTDSDLATLAKIAVKMLPPFGQVLPVLRGGARFAMALSPYTQEGGQLLIVDDVLTTGNSMEEIRDGRSALGIVIFARNPCPQWVTAIWHLGLVRKPQVAPYVPDENEIT